DPVQVDAQLAEGGSHQIVGDRTLGGDAGDLQGDGIGFEDADPDRQVAVGLLLLEDHDVLAGGHVDPDAVDADLYELVRVLPPWPMIPAARRVPATLNRHGGSPRPPT